MKQREMETLEEYLRKYGGQILPPGHPSSRMAQMVMDRLLSVIRAGDTAWEVVVIDDPNIVGAKAVLG